MIIYSCTGWYYVLVHLMMIGGKGVGLCRCDVSEIFENISLSHFLVGGRREDFFFLLSITS